MNLNNFTIKAQELLQHAQQTAFNNQNPQIETVHMLKALLDDKDGPIQYLLKKNNVNISFIEKKIEAQINKLPKQQNDNPAQNISRDLNNVLLPA